MKKTLFTTFFAATLMLSACSSESKAPSKSESSEELSNDKQEASKSSERSNSSSTSISTSDDAVLTEADSGNRSEKRSSGSDSKESNNSGATDGMRSSSASNVQTSDNTSTRSKSPSTSNEETPSFDIHKYKKWDAFLGKYVTSSGNVKYASIKKNQSELDAIVSEFEQTTPSSSWSKNETMAFWINAYNVFTVKLIVDNYPTSSIKNITAKPWDKKFISIGGKTYDLNTIENGILRKKYNEPRIHFAVNCASESCPILLNKAYTSSNLNSLLTSQTKKFLNDTSKNSFSKKEAKISSIFNWYKEDFGDVWEFIKKYHPLDYTPKKTSYMDYSWALND